MPARDLFHDQVIHALIKDGWTITDDPLHIRWGNRHFYVDLGAERLLAAEKAERKIAVEIKGFVGKSDVQSLEQALGQFVLYGKVLSEVRWILREFYFWRFTRGLFWPCLMMLWTNCYSDETCCG